jgi:hypothetical protein
MKRLALLMVFIAVAFTCSAQKVVFNNQILDGNYRLIYAENLLLKSIADDSFGLALGLTKDAGRDMLNYFISVGIVEKNLKSEELKVLNRDEDYTILLAMSEDVNMEMKAKKVIRENGLTGILVRVNESLLKAIIQGKVWKILIFNKDFEKEFDLADNCFSDYLDAALGNLLWAYEDVKEDLP